MINKIDKSSFKTISSLTVALVFSVGLHASETQPVRGVVKSVKEALITVDLNARVIKTPLREGDSFSKNDVLIEFDCDAIKAERKAAKASYAAASATYNSDVELQIHGAIGDLEVGLSEAQMKAAKARLEVVVVRSRDCVLKAPYNGRVAELVINNHEIAGANQPLLKIVGSDELELKLIVPSNWLAWLEVGSVFTFEVDETGLMHESSVSSIGAEVDAVSRTVPITARFNERPGKVLPGMSGTALFDSAIKQSSL